MIYFFFGSDNYALSQEVKKLKASFSDVVELPFDEQDKLREVLQAQGLFAGKKLVILRGWMEEAPSLKIREGGGELCDVVFVEESPDRRTRGYKFLMKNAEVREFTAPIGPALGAWITSYVQTAGGKIEARAVAELLGRVGEATDTWRYAGELDKLILFASTHNPPLKVRGEGGVITQADVQKLVRRALPDDVFALTNFFAEGRGREATVLLDGLLGSGQPLEIQKQAILVVGALASQIRSLILVKSVKESAPAAAAKTLGWKEGRVWINQKLAGKFDDRKLRVLLRDLLAIDRRLKTSEEPPKLLLNLFIQKARV